jgi:RNA polymerase sigma factor (sigma-70 family)
LFLLFFNKAGNAHLLFCILATDTLSNPNLLQEIDLVKRCQQAEPKAQELLYSRYSNGLYRLAFRYVKSQADAEDILIKAFTKVFSNMHNFAHQGNGSLLGWMKRIVINEALMWLRRRHTFDLLESVSEATEEAEFESFSELEAEDIYKFITLLPDGYRTVFNLSVVEGYSHQEIAVMLSINESTSRTQLFKAKAALKKMLIKEGFQYGT